MNFCDTLVEVLALKKFTVGLLYYYVLTVIFVALE